MSSKFETPRILFVTPEVSYLPAGMSAMSDSLKARAGRLADVSAALISAVHETGADVHVALPDYRTLFNHHRNPFFQGQLSSIRAGVSETKVHLAQDRVFFYKKKIYSNSDQENLRISLSFQREVINTIVPRVQPDLIHCNDWMTGLIPAMARRLGIPCLFTIHNIYNGKALLSSIEDRGIDAALFWKNLFFERQPVNYEETRGSNPVDFLASGIFAAHFVNTVCPGSLCNIIQGEHPPVDSPVKTELLNKVNQGCASDILNYPDPSLLPETDALLFKNYDEKNHVNGKKANKIFLQEKFGLIKDPLIPLFFWPVCPDGIQNGSQLPAVMLYDVLSRYKHQNMEMIFAAKGNLQRVAEEIVQDFDVKNRVVVCGLDDSLSSIAHGASDFVLFPPEAQPAGLGQIIGLLYGTLPIVHKTKGNHEIITPLDIDHDTGNGFILDPSDTCSLFMTIDKAMMFYNNTRAVKTRQIRRIMKQSRERFNPRVTAAHYMELYGRMLKRPFINQ